MSRHAAKLHISLGLTSLLASVLVTAAAFGIIPDPHAQAMKGRGALCESVAVHGSLLVGRGDVDRLEQALRSIVRRNHDVASAVVRQQNGKVIAKAGEVKVAPGDSRWTVRVPLWAGRQKWGSVELEFAPLAREGVLGFLLSPIVLLTSFVSLICFGLFFLYLTKVLQHLDPSRVVPQRVRSALDTLAEGLLLMDRRERIVLANQAFADRLGVEPESLQGRKASSLPWIQAKENGETQRLPWIQALETGALASGEMLSLEQGANRRTFLVNSAPVLGDDAKLRGVVASFEDVTLLQEKEVELKEAKETAEAASRAKGDFLAHMSHEIRTPLNAVIGFTEVLRRGLEEGEAARRDCLDTIHSSGRHLLELINDVLDLSKIEAGHLEIEKIKCSPIRVVSDVVAVLRGRAEQKGVSLTWRISGKVPETIVTDPGRLRQVLMNLTGNAIKFTERGSVTITLGLAGSRAEPELACAVADTGIGISPEGLERLFQPFTQADSSITRRFGGTGLGLSISKKFVEALGGRLRAESTVGSGSTFTATVATGPLDGVALVEAGSEETAAPPEAAPAGEIRRLPHARILLVDDGESNRKLAGLVLRRAGAEVDTAEDGQAAIDTVARKPFDLILMDMQMPVVDGYEATARLREQGLQIPIIALTAHAMKGEEEKCRAVGCTGFITKPIDLDLLLRTVAAKLGDGAPAPAGAGGGGTPAGAHASPDDAEGVPLEVRSRLDLDDAEFLEIVAEFVDRLRGKMGAMQKAAAAGDLDELARLAHWLKGAGGTAGFDVFTEPARELELAAKRHEVESVRRALAKLGLMVERIVVPEQKVGQRES